MDVRFITTTSEKFIAGSVPVIAGQIIALSDAPGYFYDMHEGNVTTADVKRYSASGIVTVNSLSEVASPIVGQIYLVPSGSGQGVYLYTSDTGFVLLGSTRLDALGITVSAEHINNTINKNEKGKADGVATLDSSGKVPSAQLPSYVDDTIEGYMQNGKFYRESTHTTEITPESGKIYVDVDANLTYRWSGSMYVEISKSLALGETESTAYQGKKGAETTETVRKITSGELEVTRYTNSEPTVSAIGGIPAGTTFDNMPMSELLTSLLYPYIAPMVTASASPKNGGTFEKGVPQSVTQITVNVTKKSSAITKVEVFDGSTSLGAKTDGSTGSLAFPVSLSVTSDKRFTAKVTDASGNTVSANTGQFTFVYPYFCGVINSGTAITEAVVEGLTKKVEGKGKKTIAFTANNQQMVLAYPKSYGMLTKIVDPNQFDVTATWAVQEISITGPDNQAIAYYVYVSNAVTVSNYSMQFNY